MLTLKHVIRGAIATALILMIPVIGMKWGEGWLWTGFDFAIMGVFLFIVALAFQYAIRKGPSLTYRLAGAAAVLGAFFMAYVNMAVGIIGEDNPANLAYFLIVLGGIVGAVASNLKPHGLARTTAAMAVATPLVPVLALLFWRIDVDPGMAHVFMLSVMLAVPFVVSALLFGKADKTA